MRLLGALVAVVVLGGCASTRMMQRDGCWVKQTEKWPKRITEELGPCARTQIQWADDRLTRLVQECVAQADHRWQTHALQAWAKGQPLPAQESEEALMDQCLSQASASLLPQHEALQARVQELDAERGELRQTVAEDRRGLREDRVRMIDALAEAAKKPAPSAVANATSNGTATSAHKSEVAESAATWMPTAQGPMMPSPVMCGTAEATRAPAPKRAGVGPVKTAKKKLPACDPNLDPAKAAEPGDAAELARKDEPRAPEQPVPAAPVTP